jgi:hypothetical protein
LEYSPIPACFNPDFSRIFPNFSRSQEIIRKSAPELVPVHAGLDLYYLYRLVHKRDNFLRLKICWLVDWPRKRGFVPFTFDRKPSQSATHVPSRKRAAEAESAPLGTSSPQFSIGRIPIMPLPSEPLAVQRTVAAASAPHALDTRSIHEAARFGTRGPGGTLPYLGRIQESFGHHPVGTTRAHTDANAREGSRAMGAEAFATGGRIAFAGPPSLRRAAHEAAHVVQQRAGVHLEGGVGRAGDRHERHAEAVADRVVEGKSSEPLLDEYAGHGISAPTGGAVQRDETRPATSKNDTWMGQQSGPVALPGTKFISDPYDHTVVVVNPDGTGTQYTYEIVPTEDGPPRERLLPEETQGKPLSKLRVAALERMNKAGSGEAQETTKESTARQDADKKVGNKARADWAKEHPTEEAAYQAQLAEYDARLAALPPEKKKPPPKPPTAPKGRPTNKKTTLCTAWPGEVYHNAGGNPKQSFPFTPPKDFKSWRTLATNPGGPSPGDIYYLWDTDLNRAAHMGVFKSAAPISGHPDLMRWVVTDGGQGDYTGIQQVNERSRTFNKKTGMFQSDLADAGQAKGNRRLEGWIDIDAQKAEK